MEQLGERRSGMSRRHVLAGAGTAAVLGTGVIATVVGSPESLPGGDGAGAPAGGADDGPSTAQTGSTIDGTLEIAGTAIESPDGTVSSLELELDGDVAYDSISGRPDTLELQLYAGWPDETVGTPDNRIGTASSAIADHDSLGPVAGERAYAFAGVDLLDSEALTADAFTAAEGEEVVRDVAIELVAQLRRSDDILIEATLSDEFAITVVNLSGSLEVTGEGRIVQSSEE